MNTTSALLNKTPKIPNFGSFLPNNWRVSFTGRGLLTILLGLYLLFWIGVEQEDVLATLIGIALLTVSIVISLASVIQYFYIKSKFHITSFQVDSFKEKLSAGEKASLGAKLSSCSILPLFRLSIQPKFEYEKLNLKPHILSGSLSESSFISQEIEFPHRGVWVVKHTEVSLWDIFGLSRFTWNAEVPKKSQSIVVAPKAYAFERLPIITSCQKVGDLLYDEHNRHGDPFDIKRYHPSDSSKKIIWKIYAKRRELLSRHPEASMSPEGVSVLITAAGTADDRTAKASINYASALRETDIALAALVRGDDELSPATSSEELEDRLVEAAWTASKTGSLAHTCDQLEELIENLGKDGVSAPSILVFLDSSQIESQEEFDEFNNLFMTIEQASSTPVIFDVSQQSLGNIIAVNKSKISAFVTSNESDVKSANTNFQNSLLSMCVNRQWRLVQVK